MVDCDAESFNTVLHNLSLFIEKVHTGAYDPGLVRREFFFFPTLLLSHLS